MGLFLSDFIYIVSTLYDKMSKNIENIDWTVGKL